MTRSVVPSAGLAAALCLLCALASCPVCAQEPFLTKDHYDKRDVLIPMRDGVKLYTVIFTPKDAGKTYPILLNRTPYSVPYGPNSFPGSLGPSPQFARSGYIFVDQDVRGQFMSEGTFVNMRPELPERHGPREIDESTDTYDTIDWLIKNVPANNGRVGMWGISYPGFYAAAALVGSHPALKAVSPQAPIADWFIGDDDNHNGANFLMDNFAWDFSTSFDTPRAGPTREWPKPLGTYGTDNAYRFYLDLGPLKNGNERYFKGKIPFWNELMEHDTYDAYWKARALTPHLTHVRPAVLLVSGWYDAEDLYGPFALHRQIERSSPGTPLTLAVGPWPHGGWAGGPGDRYGDISFGEKTGVTFRETIEFPFFERYLKEADAPRLPAAMIFQTGADRWRSFDAWPPRGLKQKSLYFHADGALQFDPPGQETPDAFDSYVSDPASPVPYSAAATTQIERRSEYMIEDQRFLAGRTDLLSYRTGPLAHDVTLLGPIQADLYAATTGTDADYIVKVIDVYPEDAPDPEPNPNHVKMAGYQQLVRAQVMRGKFRDGFERPVAFVPGQVTPVRFALMDVGHTFKAGHRILVQVQSSWFPLVDRNPQTFGPINRASESDFRKAEERIYRNARYPSHLVVGVEER